MRSISHIPSSDLAGNAKRRLPLQWKIRNWLSEIRKPIPNFY